MKKKSLSTSLSWLVALALLLTAFLSVSAVSAAPSPTIVLSQTSGETGSSITVSGHDFSPNYYYYIFVGQLQNFLLGRGTIGPDGTFSQSISINFTTPGNFQVLVYASAAKQSSPTYNSNYDQGAVAFFNLLPTPDPNIVLAPSKGKPGTSINITGQYFTHNYFYYVFFDGTYKAKGIVDDSGKFTQSITIPVVFNMGSYDITVAASKIDDTSPSIGKTYDETATTYFTVVFLLPSVVMTNNEGKVGDTFTLSGSDFSSGDTIIVYWDGAPIGSTFFPTTSNTFEGKSFTVPETYFGTHTIKVANKTQQVSLSYTVIPDITLSSSSLVSGDKITLSGTGFAAASDITFYLDNNTLPEKTVSSVKGTLSSQAVTLSNITAGSHIIKAQDGAGNSATKEITISSPQPASPSPTATATATSSPTVTTPPTTTVATPTSTTTSATQTTATPAKTPSETNTSTQPQTTSSTFPAWGIVVIIIVAVLIVIVVVVLIISRRKSFH